MAKRAPLKKAMAAHEHAVFQALEAENAVVARSLDQIRKHPGPLRGTTGRCTSLCWGSGGRYMPDQAQLRHMGCHAGVEPEIHLEIDVPFSQVKVDL